MITARLESWSWDSVHPIIWGRIYDDERKRFHDGTLIHTSMIDKTEFKELKSGDIVKTLNSSYLLGEPYIMSKETKHES